MKTKSIINENRAPTIIIITGVALRLVFFIINLILGGHNSDEVMTSINAYSLADRLTDINGERLPVYFDTWVIGGQSPFATYLTALSVKILGKNLFAVRLPALIFSILGFIALYYFAKEVFKDKKYQLALLCLGAISPWMIYSATYVLDCNYLGHFIIFAFLFLSKAVKSGRTVFYILACTCFSLGFYCYIASIFLIPFLLLSLYLVLLIKKKISFKNLTISVVTVLVIAIPFILWGLVITGRINEFKLLGFNFSEMPGYIRKRDTILDSGGITDVLMNLIINSVSAFLLLFLNDWSVTALASNLFPYGLFLSGIICTFGIIKLLFVAIKKSGEFNFLTKLFSIGVIASTTAFCACVSEPHLGSLYRYGILSYMLVFVEAIGIVEVAGFLKRKNFYKFLFTYSALALTMFITVYITVYIPQSKDLSEKPIIQEFGGDSFFDCLDYARDNDYDNILIYKNTKVNLNTAAYLRYYYYGKKDCLSIEDEISKKNEKKDLHGNYLVTEDGEITYCWIDENNVVQNDFCIVETDCIDEISFDKEKYSTKRFGFWSIVYKEKQAL